VTRRLLFCLAILAAGSICSTATAGDDYTAAAGPASLAIEYFDWSGSAWGNSAAGFFCRLEFPDGSWRGEIIRADDRKTLHKTFRAALLDRKGQGWTVVAPDSDNLMLQSWGGPLRRPDSEQIRALLLLGLIIGSTEALPDVDLPPGVDIGPEGPDGDYRLQLVPMSGPDDAGPRTAFRAAMEQRGRGRGSAVETWIVSRRDNETGSGIRIRSSRREGSLSITPRGVDTVWGFADEAVIPLWPLSELVFSSAREASGQD